MDHLLFYIFVHCHTLGELYAKQAFLTSVDVKLGGIHCGISIRTLVLTNWIGPTKKRVPKSSRPQLWPPKLPPPPSLPPALWGAMLAPWGYTQRWGMNFAPSGPLVHGRAKWSVLYFKECYSHASTYTGMSLNNHACIL